MKYALFSIYCNIDVGQVTPEKLVEVGCIHLMEES
jgi:hypothetical protein